MVCDLARSGRTGRTFAHLRMIVMSRYKKSIQASDLQRATADVLRRLSLSLFLLSQMVKVSTKLAMSQWVMFCNPTTM